MRRGNSIILFYFFALNIRYFCVRINIIIGQGYNGVEHQHQQRHRGDIAKHNDGKRKREREKREECEGRKKEVARSGGRI